ncbi:MAG: type II toxin-antitoxin system VapC family toxin [Candidatus Acidiferrales bacterium]
MSCLLDTSACIALINQNPPAVSGRFDRALAQGEQIFVSVVAAFELWYGVAKSARKEANAKRVETFFAGPLTLLLFDEDDAQSAGRIRAALESAGKPINAYDVLVAGQALRHEFTLITANIREFRRVKGLVWEDWTRT